MSESNQTTPTFDLFGLDERILNALADLGFEQPTPIQAAALPALLEGRDMIGRARTGSGKTAAFGLPLLQRVREGGNKPRALVLSPTRELAKQIGEALADYGGGLRSVRGVTIYGGAPYPPQIKALKRGASVVVGTPGRVIDLLDGGSLDLSELEMFVLDEADEMLRMGFIDDVERLLAETPEDRQVALFSATMPEPIRRVANRYLKDPVEVQVEEKALTVEHIQQRYVVAPARHKLEALQRILRGEPRGTTLVFGRTRVSCNEVADSLRKAGHSAEALHGDLSQAARERILHRLRQGDLKLLVATDVAARGLDVGHITHVVNLDIPESHEVYVHRIGRTGRAGRDGKAITIVTPGQQRFLDGLQRHLDAKLERMEVPSDASIINRRRSQLADRLSDELDQLDFAEMWLAELQEEKGWTTEETAVRALRLLASKAGVSLSPLGQLDDEPPEWSRRPQRRERGGGLGGRGPSQRGPRRDESDYVQLYVAVGRRHGVRPADLVGAIAGETGVPGSAIGRIHIADGASFVEMPPDVAKSIVARFDKVEVRGVQATVDLARTSPPGEGRSSNRRPFGQGPRGGRGGNAPAYKRKFGGGPGSRRGGGGRNRGPGKR